MRSNKTLIGAAAALAAVMAIPAVASADAHEAKVRVGHFSPDAPAVDVYANGGVILENVPFGVISEFLVVEPGEYQLQVVPTGASLDEGPVVIDATVPFEGGTSTTVAATGFLAEISPVLLDDSVELGDGQAQMRVVHFSPDAPAVDVAPDGAEALLPGLGFPNDTGYVALAPADYDLEVRVAGTEDVAIQLDPIALAGDTAYSVFAIGSLDAGTLTVLSVVDVAASMHDEMSEDGE